MQGISLIRPEQRSNSLLQLASLWIKGLSKKKDAGQVQTSLMLIGQSAMAGLFLMKHLKKVKVVQGSETSGQKFVKFTRQN